MEATNISKSSCTLLWKPPKEDGGSKITHYMIEKRDCSKNKDAWVPYADHCKDTTVNVQGLIENSEYEFRVMAVNVNGISEPLLTETSFIAKLPFGVPGRPGVPDVEEIGSDFVTLTWTKPVSNGGGAITGYMIEKREKGENKKWIPCNKTTCEVTIYNVPNLIEDQEYEFRIFAKNEAGLSEPSEASKMVIIKDPNAVLVPEFKIKLQDCEVAEGKTACFECEISANNLPEVSFFKGSKEIYDGNKYKITNDGCKYKLFIENVSQDDQEEYSVKASNRGASRMSHAYLTVKCNFNFAFIY